MNDENTAGSALVYVVDDHDSMREALTTLLRSVDLNVLAFASAQEFLALDKPDVPSCLILDVRLKGQSGLAVQDQIVAGALGLPIIFITAYGDIEMSVKAMKNGAFDFLAKPFRDQDLLDAVASALLHDKQRRDTGSQVAELRNRFAALTPREREVMSLVTAGLMNKQIAANLDLSEITVKIHRKNAMVKMGARSLADLVLKAQALGINAALTR
ncbi:response regulator transcription factor [Burkholderia sp. Ac-20379]|uniref:response regulator transcription factor n=1 Tax=Burkholderia sp. Ac-20379 TaxID=2703900 RepID=UPI00197F86F5|nr:response regulator [Burkholderia sp. Ac-20379]MBN3727100.1 response regulator transcription factor [Burkholderia sp. Ac-20379]